MQGTDPLDTIHYPIAMTRFAAFALASGGAGAAKFTADGFRGGVEIGVGSVRRTTTVTHTDSTFYMAFKGGYAVSGRLLLGVELGGYALDAGDLRDPSEGAGVSRIFLTAQ